MTHSGHNWTLHVGDCRAVLQSLPDRSVNCCVTSPPYWGLRDYGTGSWDGGDPECDHATGGQVPDSKAPGAITTGQWPGVDASVCRKCGALRVDSQMGLEQTPEAYVAEMVAVFREVRRVLRDDGVLWLNLGDCYASTPPGCKGVSGSTGLHGGQTSEKYRDTLARGCGTRRNTIVGDLKPKDLVGIPWMVAFALRADGWYLRSDVIWSKPNPMPERVTDRPTKGHEYLFLLSKSGRYWYDAEAIAEKAVVPAHKGNPPIICDGTRNRRTVWTIATEPYSGAHFAAMPTALVEPCILAGCPKGGTVLDPFAGAGTVLYMATILDRNSIGIELNPVSADLCATRLTAGRRAHNDAKTQAGDMDLFGGEP